ncbi:MAG: hypothetical protein JKY19_01910 [Alcanivoracaceae bacterium]|nr:hypothetical protein [Alcanivoracaceae bacterium]
MSWSISLKHNKILFLSTVVFGTLLPNLQAHEFDKSLNIDNQSISSVSAAKLIAFRGSTQVEEPLFLGTSTNENDPSGTLNNVYSINTSTDVSTVITSGIGVWGATADIKNQRILFTRSSGLTPLPKQIVGGDELFEVPYFGGPPVSMGRITDGSGNGFRIDGLAMSSDVLYGVHAGGNEINGLYSIDLQTFLVTNIALFPDSISGLGADPRTSIIYGTNDTTGQLVSISTTGLITNIAPYPDSITDIDGLAIGNGLAYLVIDEPGFIPVYDLVHNTYVTSLTSPFTTADDFTGAALAVTDVIFENSFE